MVKEINNLTAKILDNLSRETLMSIVATGDPISFGYRTNNVNYLVSVSLLNFQSSEEVHVDTYKKSLLALSPRLLESSRVKINTINHEVSSVKNQISRSLEALNSNTLAAMSRSKEPLTLTYRMADGDRQLEVTFDDLSIKVHEDR